VCASHHILRRPTPLRITSCPRASNAITVLETCISSPALATAETHGSTQDVASRQSFSPPETSSIRMTEGALDFVEERPPGAPLLAFFARGGCVRLITSFAVQPLLRCKRQRKRTVDGLRSVRLGVENTETVHERRLLERGQVIAEALRGAPRCCSLSFAPPKKFLARRHGRLQMDGC